MDDGSEGRTRLCGGLGTRRMDLRDRLSRLDLVPAPRPNHDARTVVDFVPLFAPARAKIERHVGHRPRIDSLHPA